MDFSFIFLTDDFYRDFSHCPEIEKKRDRPYIRVLIHIDQLDFAVPLRSHIRHPNAFLTDKANGCGLDYSKAVVITQPERYIDRTRHPRIRQNEFDALRGKKHVIEAGMERYLKQYRNALLYPELPRNQTLLCFSTLQYFHDSILPKEEGSE